MKSRLLISLLSAGFALNSLPAQSEELDSNASRGQKWLWAFSTISSDKTPSKADRAKAYKIVQDEESILAGQGKPAIQSASTYVAIVDFYRKAGDIQTAKAKEVVAANKIEQMTFSPGLTEQQRMTLADCLDKLAKFHIDNTGLAKSPEDFVNAEHLYVRSIRLRDQLQASDHRRTNAYRSIIKFYLDNNKPEKANTFTIKLSNLMNGIDENAYVKPVEVKRPINPYRDHCLTCGKG